MANIMSKRGTQDNVITYEHYCDTKADLANIPKDQITLGSTAVVLQDEDGSLGVYIAGSDKQWIAVAMSGGSGSDSGQSNDNLKKIVEKTVVNIQDDTINSVINGLSNISTLTTVEMTEVNEIKKGAFASCAGLEMASFPKCSIIEDGDIFYEYEMYPGYYSKTYQPHDGVFMGCSKLSYVELGDISAIGSLAFYNCQSLNTIKVSSLEKVNFGAFYNCINLSEINLEECTIVEDLAFQNCSSLTELILPECLEVGNSAYDGITHETYPTFAAEYAFGMAFNGCENVSKAIFPKCEIIHDAQTMTSSGGQFGSSVYFRNGMFANNSQLTEISFPQCEYVGAGAFNSCIALTNVALPACKTLRHTAFAGCTNLTSISLPVCNIIDGLTSNLSNFLWEDQAEYAGTFGGCTALSTISLPQCTEIGTGAFAGCTSLTEVYIPECISIGCRTFGSCLALEEIHLPKLSTLFESAFEGCENLQNIYLDTCSIVSMNAVTQLIQTGCNIFMLSNTIVQTLDSRSFPNYLIYSGSVFVPESLVETYKTDSYWTGISSYIAPYTGE